MQERTRYHSNLINFINHYLGWRNWSVLTYNSIAENVFIIFFIALREALFGTSFVLDFFIFFSFSLSSTSYGYLINDFADRNLDARHGKPNTFQNDSTLKALLVVILFAGISLALGLRFAGNQLFLFLWIGWVFLATFYSLRPFRLKEKGVLGLFAVVAAQRVLPILITFAAFKYYGVSDIIIFTCYVFFRGLSSDLNHQIEDYQKDSMTGTDTYAVENGLKKARKAFRLSLELEKVFLILCLLSMYFKLSDFNLYGVSLVAPMLILYLLLCALGWMKITAQGPKLDVNPFVKDRKDLFQFTHHTFPSVVLPFYLLLILVSRSWPFVSILVLFSVYRKLYSIDLIRSSFPLGVIREIAVHLGIRF
jgi:4-hydroxybenzoate polyprenyltransferase